MSLSGALSSAVTGLTAAAKSAEVVSSNLANVMTDGYGRRSISLSSQSYDTSGGVSINGITRYSNPVTLAERRLADADFALNTATNDFFERLEFMVGTPDDASSLSGQFADFESSLVMATGASDSQVSLDTAVQSATQLANSLNAASDGIQSMRTEADGNISTMVERLNALLQQTEDANKLISLAINQGHDTSALQDDRQRMVDEMSELVPIKVVARDRGSVAIYTTNGAVLLDGNAAEIEFNESPTVLSHMTANNGLLSGLTINGYPADIDAENGALGGGAIGGQFAIRDEYGEAVQADLDAMARDLVERFQSPTVDPTLAAGDPGLFTDGGAAFAVADEVGLAGRISINSLVDPDGADESWRLRDGLGAPGVGDVGDATQLNRLLDALQVSNVAASGSFGPKALTTSELSAQFLSSISSNRVESDVTLAYASTRLSSLQSMELADGVDSDSEMQQLMLIEQAYSANARMLQTVDEMINVILGL